MMSEVSNETESGISPLEIKKKKIMSKLILIKNFSGTFIEVGCMAFMIFVTLFLIVFEEEKLAIFFIISVIGIGLFISESWKKFYAFHFINLWYFWLLVSFSYFLLDYEIEFHLILDIALDTVIFSFLFYISYYEKFDYPLFWGGTILLINLVPFDSHNSFHSIIESSIRCILFFIMFILQSFYRVVSFQKMDEQEGCLVILRNNYLFFSNIWTLIFFFPLHVILISIQLYKKWPSTFLLKKILSGNKYDDEDQEEEEEEEQQQQKYETTQGIYYGQEEEEGEEEGEQDGEEFFLDEEVIELQKEIEYEEQDEIEVSKSRYIKEYFIDILKLIFFEKKKNKGRKKRERMERRKKKKGKGKGNFKKLKDDFLELWKKFLKSKKTQKVKDIMTHPRNPSVSLRGRAFRVGPEGSSILYTGLTHRLHDMFWPNTNEDHHFLWPFQNEGPKRQPLINKSHYIPSKGLKSECKTNGSHHGTKVHSQIKKFVDRLTTSKNLRISSSLDPCTLRILRLFLQKRWIPFASELAIYDEPSKIATAIDVLVFDMIKHELVIIELKTGYEGEEYGPLEEDERMDRINVKNCPKSRHELQLLWMILILKKNYDISVDNAFILRVCPKQKIAMLLSLEKWTMNETFQKKFTASLELNN